MKEELQKALSNANYRVTLENQKQKLKEILEADLILAYNGGYFKLGPILFSEIKMYLDDNKKMCIILDEYQNPIRIENIQEFYDTSRSKYNEAINKYSLEIIKLNKTGKNRTVKNLTEISLEEDIEE